MVEGTSSMYEALGPVVQHSSSMCEALGPVVQHSSSLCEALGPVALPGRRGKLHLTYFHSGKTVTFSVFFGSSSFLFLFLLSPICFFFSLSSYTLSFLREFSCVFRLTVIL